MVRSRLGMAAWMPLLLWTPLSACDSASEARCGDGRCEGGETPISCPDDCAVTGCGDGVCGAEESASRCPVDCFCGNGTCDAGESYANCLADCPWICADEVCDIVPQCGCPDGEKCTQGVQSEENLCAPSGTLEAAEPCLAQTDCAEDFYCLEDLAGVPAVCYRWCLEDEDCAPSGPGAVCSITMQDVPPGTPKLCSFACHPMTNAGCPVRTGCELTDGGAQGMGTRCSGPRGTGTGACTDTLQCEPGLVCDNVDHRCTTYCRLGEGNADCAPGDTCYALSAADPLDGVVYGMCGL